MDLPKILGDFDAIVNDNMSHTFLSTVHISIVLIYSLDFFYMYEKSKHFHLKHKKKENIGDFRLENKFIHIKPFGIFCCLLVKRFIDTVYPIRYLWTC